MTPQSKYTYLHQTLNLYHFMMELQEDDISIHYGILRFLPVNSHAIYLRNSNVITITGRIKSSHESQG